MNQENPIVAIVKCDSLSKGWWDPRFIAISKNTGKVLADGNGYGYKTPENAMKAWMHKVEVLNLFRHFPVKNENITNHECTQNHSKKKL